MDLSKLDTGKACAETARLLLLGPNDERLIDDESGEQLYIDLLGVDCPQYQSLQHKQNTARLRRRTGRGGRIKFNTREIESDTIELYAEMTKGWGPKLVVEGKALECNKENAVAVYHRFLWITRQIDAFMEEMDNWLGESSTSSSPTPALSSDSSRRSRPKLQPEEAAAKGARA